MKSAHIISAMMMVGSIAAYTTSYADNSSSLTANQKTQIENVVHNYLVQNPEVIVEAAKSLQQREMNKMTQQTQQAALLKADALFKDSSNPVAGNAKGKLTIVEFFDYQCPHCVDMVPALDATIKANPDVRVVYKEFPIRGPLSQMAAKAALAANLQGKYLPMHDAIMQASQNLSKEVIDNIAKSLGLNMEKFTADMEGAKVDQQLKGNFKLAQDLQLMGTPAIFVGLTNSPKEIAFVPGQVDQAYLQELVAKLK